MARNLIECKKRELKIRIENLKDSLLDLKKKMKLVKGEKGEVNYYLGHITIYDWDLSTRTVSRLTRAGVTTLKEFIMLSDDKIINTPGIGKNTLNEIQMKLAELKTNTIEVILICTNPELIKFRRECNIVEYIKHELEINIKDLIDQLSEFERQTNLVNGEKSAINYYLEQTKISDWELSGYAVSRLMKSGITTLKEFMMLSNDDLKRAVKTGNFTYNEIRMKLDEIKSDPVTVIVKIINRNKNKKSNT